MTEPRRFFIRLTEADGGDLLLNVDFIKAFFSWGHGTEVLLLGKGPNLRAQESIEEIISKMERNT